MFFTGSHRLLNFKNFKIEIICGLVNDFLLFILPLMMLQGLNDATIAVSMDVIDSVKQTTTL
jgi:hypothetical protein